MYAKSNASHPDGIKATWMVYRSPNESAPWIKAPNVKVLSTEATANIRAQLVDASKGSVPDVRTCEGRRNAIDLEQIDAKRACTLEARFSARMAKARSVCTAAVDAKARKLMQSAMDDFMSDKIDGATLEQRKAAARQQAVAEYAPLTTLDAAYDAHVSAEEKVKEARAALVAAIAALLPEEAGSSEVQHEGRS